MTKHERAEAARGLLLRWIEDLDQAFTSHREKIEAMLEESGGYPVSVPNIEIRPVSRDMIEFLLSSLHRALDGDKDPFGIKRPPGQTPLTNRQKSELTTRVLAKKEAGMTEEEALAIVSDEFFVCQSTARNIFYARKKTALITREQLRQLSPQSHDK